MSASLQTCASETRHIAGTRWIVGEISTVVLRPAVFFAVVATVSFPLSLLLPFFTLQPSLGDLLLDEIFDYLEPGSMDAATYSVLAGIGKLFSEGDPVIALVLLIFSVFFPGIKLALLWMLLLRPKSFATSLSGALETLGPWSMADVFAVSVTLLAFKSFPGGTLFVVDAGYYLFLLSVASGMVAARLARPAADQVKSEHPQEAL